VVTLGLGGTTMYVLSNDKLLSQQNCKQQPEEEDCHKMFIELLLLGNAAKNFAYIMQ